MIDFSSLGGMGRLGSYTKELSMKQKWEKKQKSGNVLEKEYKTEAGRAMAAKKTAELALMEQYRESKENEDTKLSEIHNKLNNGSSLSPDEMDYLKKKDPQTYEKLKAEREDAEALKKRLESAKTKEEAQKIMQDHANKSMLVVKTVNGNPYISDADKAALLGAEVRKLRKAEVVFEKYRETGAYGRLPTEEEKEMAEEELREAEEIELEESTKAPEQKEKERRETETEKATDPDEDRAPGAKARPESVREAEHTEEAEKVKRAKTKKKLGAICEEEASGSDLHFRNISGRGVDIHA